jgi:hypothetical protein
MPRALHLTHAEWEHATDHLICALSGRLEALGTSRSPLELPSSSSRAARSRCGVPRVPRRRACVPHAAGRSIRIVQASRRRKRCSPLCAICTCCCAAQGAGLSPLHSARFGCAPQCSLHACVSPVRPTRGTSERTQLLPSAFASSRQRAFAADVVSEIAILVESTHALCSGSVAFGSCDVL